MTKVVLTPPEHRSKLPGPPSAPSTEPSAGTAPTSSATAQPVVRRTPPAKITPRS